jgi:hypothetical protein
VANEKYRIAGESLLSLYIPATAVPLIRKSLKMLYSPKIPILKPIF